MERADGCGGHFRGENVRVRDDLKSSFTILGSGGVMCAFDGRMTIRMELECTLGGQIVRVGDAKGMGRKIVHE